MPSPSPSPSSTPSSSPTRGPNTAKGDPNSVYPTDSPSVGPKPPAANKDGVIIFDGPGLAATHKDQAWASKPGGVKYGEYIYSTGAVGDEYKTFSDPNSEGYNEWQSKSSLDGSWTSLSPSEQSVYEGIASGFGHGSTARGVYSDMISESVRQGNKGTKKTPLQIAIEGVQAGTLPYSANGTGPGSGPGSSGPRTTSSVSYMDKGSAEMLLNKLATDKLGRNLTDQELKKYTADLHKQEGKNPTVTTSSSGSSVSQEGMADTDIANKILMNNPAFADNVLKTDVVDMFFNRIGGKNG